MKLIFGTLSGFFLLLLAACTARTGAGGPDRTQTYDLYIHGGTIVDGTGAKPFAGDVLVKGDKIAYVGPTDRRKIKALKSIDAQGKIVTPGFIDAHTHGDPLRADNDYMKSFLRQGVTTVILGQDGDSPGLPMSFTKWAQAVDAHGTGPNVAALVGHGSLRNLSGAGERDKVTPAQQAKMEILLAQAFDQGVYGMSTGLEYLPGRYADADELAGLAKIVGKHDGLISSHIRNEDDDKVEASVAELIAQGQYAKVNLTHAKVVYGKTKAQGEAVMQQIHEARAKGMTVTADVYPYLASYGSMIYLYPEWAKRKNEFDRAVKTRRPELDTFLRAKIKRRNGPGAMMIARGKYAGKTLLEVSKLLGKSPEDVIIDFGHRGPSAAHFIMTKATQDVFITTPDVSLCTDGSPTMLHPRAYGSFAKILEEYVVRDHVLSVEMAVHKMSGLTAKTFGLKSRGLLKAGKAADILVIDLAHVKAGTKWTDIKAKPSGFDAVIVNGHVTDTRADTQSPTYGRMLYKTNGD